MIIDEASSISTMKVERPEERSSEAPILVKIRSIFPITALVAGTYEPNLAIIEIRAVCLMNVDLPPMFGPVITIICFLSRQIELETKGESVRVSITGCLPLSILMICLSLSSGLT